MTPDSPEHASVRPPHPLCLALIDRLRDRCGAAVLEIGAGSGRNTRALDAAGFAVVPVADNADVAPLEGLAFSGALATHALLHGTPHGIAALVRAIGELLEPGAPLYATFGSVRDARYGAGEEVAPFTFAPLEGDEAGVAHAFFDESRLRDVIGNEWIVEDLTERGVDTIAGNWAHQRRPLERSVHWFATLRKR